MRYLIPRAVKSARAFTIPAFSRAHHSATAKFITISPQGTPITRDIEVWLGEPAEAYVMFDPEISKAFQTSTIAQESSPYPRLEIPQDLPRQSHANTILATLHAYGVTHAITLDGTPDTAFHHSMRETIHRLQPVLDQLKDM